MAFSYSLGGAARAILCLLLLTLVPALGCKGDDDDDDHGDHDHDAASDEDHAPGEHDDDKIGTPSGATCPDGSTLSYDTFGKAFMDEYCVKCHSTENEGETERMGAPEGHDFDLLDGILPVANHIDQYAAAGPDSVNTTMPPKNQAQPSMEEREMLGEWLACEIEKTEE